MQLKQTLPLPPLPLQALVKHKFVYDGASGREVCLGHRHPCGDQRTVCWSHVGSRDGAQAVRLGTTDLTISGHLRALEHVCFQMSSKSPCSGPGCLLSSNGREEKQLRVLKTHCSFEKSWNWTNRGYYCSSWGLKTPTPQRMGSSSQTLSYSVPAFATRSPPLWWATFVGLPPTRLLGSPLLGGDALLCVCASSFLLLSFVPLVFLASAWFDNEVQLS